jgi:enoyl-CoA hydratase/carnithine racemase
MDPTYRTLRVAPAGDGVLSVMIDAPPMNLIGPELVRDLVILLGELESGRQARVVVLESADPEYFVPHVDLTKAGSGATTATAITPLMPSPYGRPRPTSAGPLVTRAHHAVRAGRAAVTDQGNGQGIHGRDEMAPAATVDAIRAPREAGFPAVPRRPRAVAGAHR